MPRVIIKQQPRKLVLVGHNGPGLARALKFPQGDTADPTLPALGNRSNKWLLFDAYGRPAAGDLLAQAPSGYTVSPSPVANALMQRKGDGRPGKDIPSIVPTLADLDFDGEAGQVIYLLGRDSAVDGGQGEWVWLVGDYSAEVAADPLGGIWKQGASAATVGAWKRHHSGTVNIQVFGAKGDDVTDNHTAILGAVAAASNNFSLYVPEGNYRSSAQVTIPSHVEISGAGTFKPLSGFSGDAIFDFSGASNVTLRGLHFDMEGSTNVSAIDHYGVSPCSNITISRVTTQDGYVGIRISDATEVEINRCVCHNAYAIGIWTMACNDLEVSFNTVNTTRTSFGINVQGSGAGASRFTRIIGNLVKNTGDNGIAVRGIDDWNTDVSISCNHIYMAGKAGIKYTTETSSNDAQLRRASINGNTIHGFGINVAAGGIQVFDNIVRVAGVYGAASITVADNVIDGSDASGGLIPGTYYGLHIYGLVGSAITGNTINGPIAGPGLHVNSCRNVAVTGNTISETMQDPTITGFAGLGGIFLSSVEDSVIGNNTIRNTGNDAGGAKGMAVIYCRRNLINGVRASDDRQIPCQTYGVYEDSSGAADLESQDNYFSAIYSTGHTIAPVNITTRSTIKDFYGDTLMANPGWNPGPMVAGGGVSSGNISLPGATIGDFVEVAAPYAISGILISAQVIASDTVEINLINTTGDTIDLGWGYWKIKVKKL